MTRAPVGMAIIGCGRIAAAHAGAIKAHSDIARLIAFVDVDLSRAAKMASTYGAELALNGVESALERPEIEAVILCVPIDIHAEVAEQCLDAGRCVLVEKPMAANGDAAQRMLDAAKRNGRFLATAQSRRHSSAVRYVQDSWSSFGRLRSIEASFCMYWPRPQVPWWAERPREKGLVIPQLGSHSVDLVQLFMKEQPERVFAQTHRWRDCWQAEDEVMMLLSYRSGRMASVHLSYNQQPFFERCCFLFDTCHVEIRDATSVLLNSEFVHRPPIEDPNGELITNELFRNQICEFARGVRGEHNRSATADEGVAQIRILDAALRSSLSNCVAPLAD